MKEYVYPRKYYEDLYDLITIEDCLRIQNRKSTIPPSDIKKYKVTRSQAEGIMNGVSELIIYFTKGQRYQNRESSISSMINRDQERQDLYDNAIEPLDVRCNECGDDTFCMSKILDDFSSQHKRILFMFECSKCGKRRAVYEDGTDKVFKLDLCDKCSHEVKRTSRTVNEVITITTKCPSCGYVEKEVLDLKKDEKKSQNRRKHEQQLLAKYRTKYCLSPEEGANYLQEQENFKRFQAIFEKDKQQKLDPIYREMKKLKTLTVVELESMMKKALRDTGFENFTIEKPDIDRYVVVEFTVKDTKKNREDRASIYDLQKLLKTALKLTNWRLMSEGIDYRLGYLSGRLKGYEREEDLYKLAKQLYK